MAGQSRGRNQQHCRPLPPSSQPTPPTCLDANIQPLCSQAAVGANRRLHRRQLSTQAAPQPQLAAAQGRGKGGMGRSRPEKVECGATHLGLGQGRGGHGCAGMSPSSCRGSSIQQAAQRARGSAAGGWQRPPDSSVEHSYRLAQQGDLPYFHRQRLDANGGLHAPHTQQGGRCNCQWGAQMCTAGGRRACTQQEQQGLAATTHQKQLHAALTAAAAAAAAAVGGAQPPIKPAPQPPNP